ncbi:MAG: type II toxin-antitoxin system HicB family antitoxin [Chromatiaceae bacterium]|nr:type II toxin-antitoxin system HicB family antitoxin [Chromatiaceae bacterium]
MIEKDQDGYYAFCPEMKGCHSQGDSLDEALTNIKQAIALYLETLSIDERASCF